MSDGIIVAGKIYPVAHPETGHPVPVFSWRDAGLHVPEFRPGDGYNKKRMVWPVDLMVWHFTGGEGEPDRMAETLRKRQLGVEFAISRQGVIFQFCDPFYVDTADAGIANSRSIGCEVVNYGSRAFDLMVPRLGKDRSTYEAVIHGRKRKLAAFYPHQLASAVALAEAVSAAVPEITRCVPVEDDGIRATTVELSDYSGHLGHFHVSKNKIDPGFDLLNALRRSFSPLQAAPLVG